MLETLLLFFIIFFLFGINLKVCFVLKNYLKMMAKNFSNMKSKIAAEFYDDSVTAWLSWHLNPVFLFFSRAKNAQTRRTKRKENLEKIAFIVASENVFPSAPRPPLIKKGLNASLGASKFVQFVIAQKKWRKRFNCFRSVWKSIHQYVQLVIC